MSVLETERLILRPRTAADLGACLEMDRDPEVMRYVGGPPEDPEDYARSLGERIARAYPPGLGYWSMLLKPEGGRFVGWAVLVPHGEDPAKVEIGWRVRRPDWGRGYATEGAAALLRHGFETVGLEVILAEIHPGNAASERVAEKIGLRYLGPGTYDGEPCKTYGATRE